MQHKKSQLSWRLYRNTKKIIFALSVKGTIFASFFSDFSVSLLVSRENEWYFYYDGLNL